MAWYTWVCWCVAAFLALGAGSTLYVALWRDRARGRRRCPRCWYDMAGVNGLRCPECGRLARSERSLMKTRRKWRWALVALVIAGLAYAAAATPRAVRAGTWCAAVPRPVLLSVLPMFDVWGDRLFQAQMTTIGPRFASSTFTSSAPTSPWERMLLARACARNLAPAASPPAPGSPTSPWAPEDVAQWTLQELTDARDAAVPVLITTLQRCDAAHRAQLIQTIAQFGAGSEQVQTQIARYLTDPDIDTRLAAIAGLGAVPTNQVLLPTSAPPFDWDGLVAAQRASAARAQRLLAPALQDPSRRPRVEAVRVLTRLAASSPLNPDLLESLVRSVEDPRLSTGVVGVNAVASLDLLSVPALVRYLSHPSRSVRRAAVAWIGQRHHDRYGDDPSQCALAIARLLDENDTDLQIAALGALARMRGSSSAALERVESEYRASGNESVRLSAIIAIGRAGPSPGTVALLTEALHDLSPQVRREAADELGSMGTAAASAADAVSALLHDPNTDVRVVAQRAIKEIGPQPK